MKKLLIIPVGLLVAGCASTPPQYEDTFIPAPTDFRIEQTPEPVEEEIPEPKGEDEFVSANGEVCSVTSSGTGTKAICKSGDSLTEVQDIISGSI
ncbi:hypothetical protein [Sulfitobacter sp. R18_1]|uniref:hypothetical protein n=1 Tax=Sulfitobacter sp. R18_1 TaxID=2821104 RepID=UPI001ADAE886|nr:hypothetical protein [Sulfitobacter sp. R18_1]MBO9428599.1 hypothetical protein [Sulfitobacter sp. R18_1]